MTANAQLRTFQSCEKRQRVSHIGSRGCRVSLLSALMLTLAISPALAEVADKQPTVIELWIVSIFITMAAIGLGAFRPWLALLPTPLSLLAAYSLVAELNSLDVGPAILEELGKAYVVQAYCASAITIIGPLCAWAIHRSRLRKNVR